MSDKFVIKGLVLTQTRHIESNKIISVLTAERGLISIYCYGAASLKNRNFAGSQPYSFSELEISKKGDMYVLNEASVIRYFSSAVPSLENNALMMYLCELLSFVCVENEDSTKLLRLSLNSFYALCEGEKDAKLIKAAFELRIALELGFAPRMESNCIICGRENPRYLDFPEGGLICHECYKSDENRDNRENCAMVDKNAIAAISYILSCDEKKFLSFNIDGDDEKELFCSAAEKYLIYQLGRSFESLAFYKQIAK